MLRTYEMVMSELIETYDYKEMIFDEQTDEYIYYQATDFIGNRVWVKVEIDDEVALMDWDVYEKEIDDLSWDYLGPVHIIET